MSCITRLSTLFLLIICVCCLTRFTTAALYEDQVGKFDWKKELIGPVENVVFDKSVSVSKHIYVSTEKGAIACLNTRTGQIVWRRLLDDDNGEVSHLINIKDGILSISLNGMARLWDATTGVLKWEVDLSNAFEKESDFLIHDVATLERSYAEKTLLVFLTRAGLHTIAISLSRKKSDIETVQIDQGVTNSGNDKLFVDSSSGKIVHLQLQSGVRLLANIYDANDLSSVSRIILSTSWLDNLDMTALLEGNRLLYISNEVGAIHLVHLEEGNTEATTPLSNLGIDLPVASIICNKNKDIALRGSDIILSHGEGKVSQVKLKDANLKLMWTETFSDVSYIFIKQLGSEVYGYITTQTGKVVTVTALNMKTGVVDDSLTIKFTLPEHVGKLNGIRINMFLKRNSPVGFRALIRTEDESIALVTQSNGIMWQRHEALATTVYATMLDLPLSDVDARIEAEFEDGVKTQIADMFVKRISAQVSQLSAWFKNIVKELNEGTLFKHKTRDPLIQVEGMTRDPFSLHKMIVLVTKSGGLFGVDSLTGDVLWRYFLDHLKGRKLHFFVQRTTAHFPHLPQAILLGLDPAQEKPPVVLMVNPITGIVIDRSADFVNLKKPIIQAILFPIPDGNYLRPLIMMDADLKIHLLPDTAEIQESVEGSKLFMYDMNTSNGHIRGFSMLEQRSAQVVWSMCIPDTHKIIGTAGKNPLEKVDSMGRPLADRSVIYKYLNPNAVAILSESVDRDVDRSSLLLYVVDAVTGEVIHSVVHKKASGPVHIVHSENWLIYSYWNTKARRNEIASYEFYEGKSQFNDTVFSSFQRRPAPIVMQQAYIFSTGISSMGVSQTEKGITSRDILFGLERGSLFGMPRRFFDPRRPLHATTSHREEGLIQYMPEIPVPHELYLSYNLTIERIEKIYSAPAALESTSLVLATGLDLFFTRTQPSKMFDVLKEDFEHLFIAAVLVLMLAAALITRRLAQVKQLKKSWR